MQVINPPTAIRLLEEYVPLKDGDTIVQTGANSAVGKVRAEPCTQGDAAAYNSSQRRRQQQQLPLFTF